jgi:hypothetical protein
MIRSLANRLAAAAAVHDPGLMLRLRATQTPPEPR